MAFKQPGFGKSNRSSSVSLSPLSFRNKKKQSEFRDKQNERGGRTSDKTGVQLYSSQYQGMSKDKRERLSARAKEQAAKAQAKLDAGGKLSKREKSFIEENAYNVKRQKSIDKHRQIVKDKNEQNKKRVQSGAVHDDIADRMADKLRALGPDAGRAEAEGRNLSDRHDKGYYTSPHHGFVNKSFIERHPDLAKQFSLKEGDSLPTIPTMKGVKLDAKKAEQIPTESPKMEIKRSVKKEPVVEKKKVEKPVVKEEKVVKKEEKPKQDYDFGGYDPYEDMSARVSTTSTEGMRPKYDPVTGRYVDSEDTNWASALNYKGSKKLPYQGRKNRNKK